MFRLTRSTSGRRVLSRCVWCHRSRAAWSERETEMWQRRHVTDCPRWAKRTARGTKTAICWPGSRSRPRETPTPTNVRMNTRIEGDTP